VIPRLLIGDDPAHGVDLADAPDVEVWRGAGGSVVAYGTILDGQHWIDMPGVARFRFGRRSRSVMARPHPAAGPGLVEDAYRRTVLPLALQVQGTEVLHASAVRSPRGVVAFCAESGTGKSTLAAALGERGYPLWADDAIAVDTSNIPVMTVRLPFRLRLRPASAAFFGGERAARVAGPEVPEEGAAERVRVAALFVLQRTDRVAGAVSVERLCASAALPAVLVHAYCFSLREPDRKRRMLQHYVRLVTGVPVFEVRIESGLERLPEVLDGIEQALVRVG
jgi:hypothetical protein